MKKAKTSFVFDGGRVVPVQYDFADGRKLVCRLAELSEAVAAHATGMGIREALRDTFAGAKSVDEAIAAASGRWESMTGDGGEDARRGGGAAAISAEMLVEAICRADRKLDPAKVRAKTADWDAKKRTAFVKSQPQVALAMAEIIAERNNGGNAQTLGELFDD